MSKLSAASVLAALVLAPVVAHSQAGSCPTGTTLVTRGTPANPNGGGNNAANNFLNFITGAQICASRGGDRWQEFHQSGGTLIDYKRGTNPVDPTGPVGTWTATTGDASAVTHIYGGSSYTWAVCKNNTGNAYTLVSATGGTINNATITTVGSAVPCP